jgi:hypothetical protein
MEPNFEPIKVSEPVAPIALPPKKKGIVLIVIAAVIIVIAAAFIWMWQLGFFKSKTISRELAPGIQLNTALAGSLIKGFPKDLIIADDAVLIGSFEQKFATSTMNGQVIMTRYSTGESIDSIVKKYEEYFTGKGWSEIKKQVNDKTFYIAAKSSDGNNVSVNLSGKTPDGKLVIGVMLNKK